MRPGPERDRVRHAITDFLARGEMERAGNGLYRYVHAWSRGNKPSPIQARLVKAVYVSGPAFTTADIMRWAEAPDQKLRAKNSCGACAGPAMWPWPGSTGCPGAARTCTGSRTVPDTERICSDASL